MFYWIPRERVEGFNNALRFIMETYGGRGFAGDMLIALERNHSFVTNDPFMQAFRANALTAQDQSLIWRLHVLAWAATHALHLDGDFVECGVFKGVSSAVVCKYLDFGKLQRSYYLYDTFSGLTEDTSTPAEREAQQSFREEDPQAWLAEVRDRFAIYPNVIVVPGTVPHSFQQACPQQVAFLHVDMNAAQAEVLALEQLFERMPRGAVIILDDFGWRIHRNSMQAHQTFFAARGHEILELPTGQGVVIKH